MLDVIANSLMIASRRPPAIRPHETAPSTDTESARIRRSRNIAAFAEVARHPTGHSTDA